MQYSDSDQAVPWEDHHFTIGIWKQRSQILHCAKAGRGVHAFSKDLKQNLSSIYCSMCLSNLKNEKS